MHGPSRTKAESHRILALKEYGCLACLKLGIAGTPADYHHASDKPPDVSYHNWGYPICAWHHRAFGDFHPCKMKIILGPSRHMEKHEFWKRFGTDAELVAMADAIYEQLCKQTVGRIT